MHTYIHPENNFSTYHISELSNVQGFVAAHTLPVLYENYDDKIDSFMDNMFDKLRHNFRKLDAGIPSHNSTEKKDE